MATPKEAHSHSRAAAVIGDIVYGAHDGIITTFAIVAGSAGAALSPLIAVILGIANLVADGISMAASSYLSHKTAHQAFLYQRSIEEWETRHEPDEEKREVKEILAEKGYRGEDVEQMAGLITKNPKFWVDFMMNEERGIRGIQDGAHPIRSALITFAAFVLAGSVALLPYLLFFERGTPALFPMSIVASASALFLVGALKGHVVGKKWYSGGFEMLAVGFFAGSSAYAIGLLLKGIVS